MSHNIHYVKLDECAGRLKSLSSARDAEEGVENVVIVCHGVTMRAFVMMWCHLTPEWFEQEPNPRNCAIRLLEGGSDLGYVFDGFP